MVSDDVQKLAVTRRFRDLSMRWPMRTVALVLIVIVALFFTLWLSRERIADNVIASQLQRMGIPATYRIERIGGSRQVLADIKVGDPARPDLTIDRAEVEIAYPIGLPRVASVKLLRPRLYGTYRGGKLSVGVLDKLLFPKPPRPKEPFRLPDISLELVDARARLVTDYGPIGFWAEGKGGLRDAFAPGFAGRFAANAPSLQNEACGLTGGSLFGTVRIIREQPHFNGPLRLAALRCPQAALSLNQAVAMLDVKADAAFESYSGSANLRSRQVQSASVKAYSLALDSKATWRKGALNARIEGDIGGLETPVAAVALLGIDGRLRAREGLEKLEFQGTLDGAGIGLGAGLDSALAKAQTSAANSFLGPMALQVRRSLQRERAGSRLSADIVWRRAGSGQSLVVPVAQWRGGSGETLLSVSRFHLTSDGQLAPAAPPQLSGNFSTGGTGLPRITGRMEQDRSGAAQLRLTMAPYRVADGQIAVPFLSVGQARNGSIAFAGETRVSGALPGGSVRNLILPIDGTVLANGGVALFQKCVTPRFDALAFANLTVEKRAVTLCPGPRGAIVLFGSDGVRIAAGATALDLAGRLGETPVRIRSGPVGFAWPGNLAARQLDVELGPQSTATRFRLTNLSARLANDVTGSFSEAEAQLFSVPLDMAEASGKWRFAGGELTIAGAKFTLLDRQDPDRFNPLTADGATLKLAANQITAKAQLNERASGREVLETTIRHDLTTGDGHADLLVRSLTFDKALQPDRITPLALGVVANVAGQVRGTGVIDWTAKGVTSSGAFTTENLDFAAAFGPVKGLSGTVRFADLLGLVTEPAQRLKIASINPGIEVAGGEIEFAMLPDFLLRVNRGHWPFLGGTLTLSPVDLNLGKAESRRYVLVIEGLDAGQFVQHMDLENINATGTFDGELPLVFDSFGGRVEKGLLTSRPPGGNVAYVGALTYKDLSPMANFAFDALKSLDYRHMTIAMDGALEGEIVTRVRFDGVRQGAGTRRNFLTRAVGRLPIQFNINVRAPFYRLITSVKAFYDPAFIEDPRVLGLVDAAGKPLRTHQNGARPNGQPVVILPKSSDTSPPASAGVQSSESGKLP